MKAIEQTVTISAPNFQVAEFLLRGNAPYVQNAFSSKAKEEMRSKQAEGSTAKKGKIRTGKDFDLCYEESKHISTEGWCGIPASCFRAAMISACRIVNFKMTLAKLSVFVEHDGFDRVDGSPLIKITKGEPRKVEHLVRIQTTTDIRARAQWPAGWEAKVRIKFDSQQFTLVDITNLMMRVGLQVGIGEGRPDSKTSCGMGWGTFEIVGKE